MMLNERKVKILEAIINDYIETAEPIGSRTIAKKYDLGISSATIRNEMSDLEDMGYILQPHASAGRVPSDKGYRLYVDRLMSYRDLTEDETRYLREIILNNLNHMDYLMRETAKAISVLTNYTTIVSEPEVKKTKIKQIQLMPMDEKSIVLILLTDGNVIKNHVINVGKAPDYESLMQLSYVLNNTLQGRTIEELIAVNPDSVDDGEHPQALRDIIGAIKEILLQEDNVRVYTSGVNNILAFPEFSDIGKAKNLFKTFEERDILITLLGQTDSDNIQVVIGSENTLEQMQDCSVIKANYKIGGQSLGAIGIVGPTRMDYTQVASVLHGIVKNINQLLRIMSED